MWLPPAPVALDPAELTKFAAVYDLKFGGTFTIRVEGDGLRMTADGHGAKNVLAFPEYEDLPVLHNDLDERAYMLFSGAVMGDYSMFRAELGSEEKAERFKSLIETRIAGFEAEGSRIRHVHVSGTLPGADPGEVVTTIMLKGQGGEEVGFRLHWVDNELAGMSPRLESGRGVAAPGSPVSDPVRGLPSRMGQGHHHRFRGRPAQVGENPHDPARQRGPGCRPAISGFCRDSGRCGRS